MILFYKYSPLNDLSHISISKSKIEIVLQLPGSEILPPLGIGVTIPSNQASGNIFCSSDSFTMWFNSIVKTASMGKMNCL